MLNLFKRFAIVAVAIVMGSCGTVSDDVLKTDEVILDNTYKIPVQDITLSIIDLSKEDRPKFFITAPYITIEALKDVEPVPGEGWGDLFYKQCIDMILLDKDGVELHRLDSGDAPMTNGQKKRCEFVGDKSKDKVKLEEIIKRTKSVRFEISERSILIVD